MNSRVLELLKNPKNIQSEDLHLLKEEINSFPYIQNIRALHLYGIHLYDQENYQKELSTTAAYTTDKKILYQLINGKIQEKTKPAAPENKVVTNKENASRYFPKSKSFPIKREELPEKIQAKEEATNKLPALLPEIKHIYVNGERNRILFEGEENFLDDNNIETIDLESTLESGTIVTQKQILPENLPLEKEITEQLPAKEDKVEESPEINAEEIEAATSSEAEIIKVRDTEEIEVTPNENQDFTEPESQTYTPEEIINEDQITSPVEKEGVTDDSELSFHGTDSFMPEVKIESGSNDELAVAEVAQQGLNKHEEEMRRLIEEVEKKMKATKAITEEKRDPEPEILSRDINFSETQSFHPEVEKGIEAEEIQKAEPVHEVTNPSEEIKAEAYQEESEPRIATEVKSEWKPMSFESHTPDSLINKPAPVSQPKEEIVPAELPEEEQAPKEETTHQIVKEDIEEQEPVQEESEISQAASVEENKEEAPVMNVSFFSSDISSWTMATKNDEENDNNTEDLASEKPHVEEATADPADSNVPGFINTWQSWLKIDRTEKDPEKDKAELKNKVIESFIENNPKISQLKDESNFVVKEKNDDISHLMTETLARLYIEQKLYTKAIKAFEILAGKHPEKKSYFEDKIQEVKDIRGKN